MRILVTMHADPEGPGSLGTFLESAGCSLEIARLYDGDNLPQDPSSFDAVVSLGGPMNVYEEARYPFLKEETDFLLKAINADVPTLGICLGAQLIAKAAGARVTLSPKKEVGWCPVNLTAAGCRDALFQGLPVNLEVLQWHGDMFHIPDGGILLAEGTDCPHQAFRCRNAYGLQFHVEVTGDILRQWFGDLPEKDVILDRHEQLKDRLKIDAEKMYTNFVNLFRK